MKHLISAVAVAAVAFVASAQAETRITYKSAKTTSSYYQMAVQIAEAVKGGSKGGMIVTVEESQGSVQNVQEAAKRTGNYVFTTPPSLIGKALKGTKPFKANAGYDKIRALFPIPSLTMHWVVRADAGIKDFPDLEGKDFVIGKGSFGARKTVAVFKALGLDGKVNFVDVELNSAVPALKNRQIHGFATAGSWPAPNVQEAGAGTDIRVLSMSEAQLKTAGGNKLVIPAGTYKGVDYDVTTISLPVGAYSTTEMDDATAYSLTKTFWTGIDAMAKVNPWWGGISSAMLGELGGKMHAGAMKYYAEAGIAVPASLK
ncbi:MAG: TAXI family TRAP transporter solute-binding subunit [Rhodospirillales bacterium]|nr:TAXI family TRAP transporter solute-binding subunit [Rhodospirillales bacterium]